jgi:catechol 2,3-dioxygenase-like lactoylglutathione lyase family enzyme
MNLTKIGAVTLFVSDPRASAAFYERTFDTRPIFEDASSAAFRFEGAVINLLARPAATELIAPAPVAADSAGSAFQMTIDVADVDEACAELQRRGVSLLNGPMDRPWGLRTASFSDPDGHIWELASDLK